MMRQKAWTALLIAAVVAMPASAATVIGQTSLNDSKVDGALVPAGTTVLSPSTVETGAYPATVHLATGHTLNLGPNSSARLEAASEGRISLAAESGDIEVGSETGEVFKLAANTVVTVAQEEVIGEGRRTGCYVDAAGMCTGTFPGGVCECTEKDAATGVCEVCTGVTAGSGGGGGTGTGIGIGTAIGIAIGAGVGGYLLADSEDTVRTEQVIILCGTPDASGNVPPGTNPPGVGGCP